MSTRSEFQTVPSWPCKDFRGGGLLAQRRSRQERFVSSHPCHARSLLVALIIGPGDDSCIIHISFNSYTIIYLHRLHIHIIDARFEQTPINEARGCAQDSARYDLNAACFAAATPEEVPPTMRPVTPTVAQNGAPCASQENR